MSGAVAVKVSGRFLSAYSIVQPRQTASPAPLPLPPPTTLVGALAASMARTERKTEVLARGSTLYSRSLELLDYVGHAVFALRGRAIPFQDLNRFLMLPYQHRVELQFSAVAFGRVSAPYPFSIIYFAREAERARKLARYAWGILSLGNKESIVSVYDVSIEEVEVLDDEEAETWYYAPASSGVCVSDCATTHMWPLAPHAYSPEGAQLEAWLVPRNVYGYGGTMRVKRSRGVFVSVGGDVVLVPQHVLGGSRAA